MLIIRDNENALTKRIIELATVCGRCPTPLDFQKEVQSMNSPGKADALASVLE